MSVTISEWIEEEFDIKMCISGNVPSVTLLKQNIRTRDLVILDQEEQISLLKGELYFSNRIKETDDRIMEAKDKIIESLKAEMKIMRDMAELNYRSEKSMADPRESW